MTYETTDNNTTEETKKAPRIAQGRIKRRKNWRAGRPTEKNVKQRGFGLVEKMFYYYYRIRRELAEVRAEQGYYNSKTGNTGGAGGGHTAGHTSDPTSQYALQRYESIPKIVIHADKLEDEVIKDPEKWIVVVEQTLMFFSDDEQEVADVLHRRFLRNEPMIRSCIEMDITKDRYYHLRDIGINYARECAIQLGLIRVFVEPSDN